MFVYYTDRLENQHYTDLQRLMSKYLEHNITSVPYPYFVTLFSLDVQSKINMEKQFCLFCKTFMPIPTLILIIVLCYIVSIKLL